MAGLVPTSLRPPGLRWSSITTCSCWGFKNTDRELVCPNCGTLPVRDINAAYTIKHFGILEPRTGGVNVPACEGLPKTSDVLAVAVEAEMRAVRPA
jgi:transposase